MIALTKEKVDSLNFKNTGIAYKNMYMFLNNSTSVHEQCNDIYLDVILTEKHDTGFNFCLAGSTIIFYQKLW